MSAEKDRKVGANSDIFYLKLQLPLSHNLFRWLPKKAGTSVTLTDLKDLADALSGFATFIGVVVGGAWTYLLFVKNRETYPVAILSQEVHQFRIASRLSILRVAIEIKNTGKVLLPICEMECRLLQVLPLSGSLVAKAENPESLVEPGAQKIAWPMLERRTWSYPMGEVELEPGETETLRCDFIVRTAVDAVQVYSHLRNSAKKSVGWSCLSQIDINWMDNTDAQATRST